jgi:hypothetical protein
MFVKIEAGNTAVLCGRKWNHISACIVQADGALSAQSALVVFLLRDGVHYLLAVI